MHDFITGCKNDTLICSIMYKYFISLGMKKCSKRNKCFYKRINAGYVFVCSISSERYIFWSSDLSHATYNGKYLYDVKFCIIRDFSEKITIQSDPDNSLCRLIKNEKDFVLDNHFDELINNLQRNFYKLLYKPLFVDNINLYQWIKKSVLPHFPEEKVLIWGLLFVMTYDYNIKQESHIWRDKIEALDAWKGETNDLMNLNPKPGTVSL